MPNQKLYAMRDTATGYVKIGISKHPQIRAYQLGALTEGEIELLLEQEVSNAIFAEKFVHRELDERRISGEWFALGDDALHELTSLFDAAIELGKLPPSAPVPSPVRVSSKSNSTLRWMLPEFLERHGLTAYKLSRVVDRKRENIIYRLARDETDPSSVNFDVLKEILDGLRELTGENVQVTDLISYTPDN